MRAGLGRVWGELGRLEELILMLFHKTGSIPASVAGTGFWKSVAGVLQPIASIGKPGQVPRTNSTASDTPWLAELGVWTTVGGGAFTPAADQTALLIDTTGPQTTITTPASPYDGQILILYDYEGQAALNPIIISANVANDPLVTVDDPSNPGGTPVATGHIAQQGMTATFKYFASAHQWQLISVTSPYVASPNSWAATAWFIDQSNKSGVASDVNPGTSRAKPLLTWKELIRRWGGTIAPTLTAATCAITFMSGSPDASDPIVARPFCNQCFFSMTADAPAVVATGTLSGVVANSITTNQALNAVLPAGTVVGSTIVNTTRANSYAKAFKNLGGNLWQIVQPINPQTLPTTSRPVQNNAWANGDTVNIFPPATNAVGSTTVFNVNIVDFRPQVVGINATFNNAPALHDIQCGDTNTNGFGFDEIYLGMGCSYINVSFARSFFLDVSVYNVLGTLFNGCYFGNAGTGGSPIQNCALYACCWTAATANYPMTMRLDCGTMLPGNTTAIDTCPAAVLGTVYVDSGFLTVTGTIAQECIMNTSYNGTQPAVYGAGGVDSRCDLVYLNTAVLSFPCAGGLRIGALSTAYSYATTAGATAIHQLAITPANIDAASGAAGFGSYAVWPGVGAILNRLVQP